MIGPMKIWMMGGRLAILQEVQLLGGHMIQILKDMTGMALLT